MSNNEFQRRRVLQLAGVGAATGGGLTATAVDGAMASAQTSDWQTETDGDADVTVLGENALDLRVFKCSTAVARKSLGTVSGPLQLSFDYTIEAEEWYEDPEVGVYEDGSEVLTIDPSPNEYDTVTGSADREVDVDGEVELEVRLVPSSFCDANDHANTYFEVRNLTTESGPATGFDARPAIPEPGTEITFDAGDSEGEIESYQWEFGDGSTATGEVATHTFDAADVYDVTLSVERSEGTSTTTQQIPVGDPDSRGDGGVSASFDWSPETPVAGEQLTVDASPSTSDLSNGSIDRYEWQFDAGSDAPAVRTGRRQTYAFDEPGEYELRLTVVDDRSDDDSGTPTTDSTTATITVNEEGSSDGFSVETSDPTTIDDVRFQSGLAAEFEPPLPPGNEEWAEIEWAFGDGTEAAGAEVVHDYDEPGTYEVTMTNPDGRTFQREVSVDPAPIEVTNVERELRGSKLLPRMPFEERFFATVETDPGVEVDEVQFSFLGNQATDDTGFNGEYEASFPLEELSPPGERLAISAIGTDEDGTTIRHDWERTIGVYQVPDWLEFLLEVANDTTIQRVEGQEREDKRDLPPRIRFVYNPWENLGLGFELPEDVLGGDDNDVDGEDQDQSYDFSFDAGAWFSPLRGYGSATVTGGMEADLMTVAFAVELGVEGVVKDDLSMNRLTVLPSAELEITPRSAGPIPLSIPIPGQNKGIGIEPTLSIRKSGELLYNPDLSFNEGTLEPGVGLTVSAGISVDLPVVPDGELRAEASGDIEGAFDIGTDDYDFRGTFFLSGKLVFDPFGVLPNAVIDGTIYELDLVGGGVDAAVVAGPEDVELVEPTVGGDQPLPAVDSVDATAGGAAVTPLDGPTPQETLRETDRLSDRPYADRQPAVATAADGRQAALWPRQREDKAADEGKDLLVRWHEDGEWTDPSFLTADASDHDSPVLAAAGDRLLAVWRTLDPDDVSTDIAGPQDLNTAANAAEIAYSVYDGDGWSDPTVLTDTERLQQRPTVAADGDGWLLAWQSVDLTNADSDVAAAQIAGVGDVTRLGDRSGAAAPATSARSDGSVDLAYVDLDDAGNPAAVVHQRLADGSVDAEDSYDAPGAATLDVADGRLVWVTNPANEPTITELRNGSRTDLSLREDIQDVRDLALVADGDTRLLSYRANLEDGPNRDIVYRLDRGDGWIYDRRAAGAVDEPLVVKDADVAFVDPSTVMTVYSARDPEIDAVADVFATTQPFAPAYALTADIDPAPAGEETVIEYTVENRGDTAGSAPVTLTATAASETTVTIDPLDAGAAVTGTVTVTVPDDGRVDAAIAVDEPTLGTEPTAVELVAATPALRFGDVEAARPEESSATVTVECWNGGGAVAEDVTVAIDGADGERLGTATIDAVAPETTESVAFSLDPTTVDPTARQTLRLDPDGDLDDDAVVRRTEPVQPFAPDLVVQDVRYRKDADVTFVEATVANEGVGPASLEYGVYDADGTQLGTTSVTVPPAIDGVRKSRRVRIEAPDLTVGQTVVHEVDVVGTDETGTGLGRTETVEAILPGRYLTATRYADEDGTVALGALRDAVGDWQEGRIDTDVLTEIIDAWQSGDPVA